MVEHAKPMIDTSVRKCEICGHKPLHVHSRGPGLHYLECPRCAIRTDALASEVDAITAWELRQVRPFAKATGT